MTGVAIKTIKYRIKINHTMVPKGKYYDIVNSV